MDGNQDAIRTRARSEMDRHLGGGAWSETERLVLTARILAMEGHCSGLAGQFTQRLADGTFRTLPLGLGFDEARPGDVLRVDDDLRVLEGHGIPNPATRFHLWIYRRRPDVMAIVHTHPPKASALAMIGRPLVSASMDSAMFYEDCAFLAEWPGVPDSDDEGRLIADALGGKRSILLASHGLLAAGASIEEACYLAVMMEHAASRQLDAEAVAPIVPVKPEHGRAAHDLLLKPSVVNATFAWLARRALRADPHLLAA